jgi:hypothetical protein
LDGGWLAFWDLGLRNILFVTGKKNQISLKASPTLNARMASEGSRPAARMLDLLGLSNNISEAMLLGVRDRKRPTLDS